MPTRSGSKCPRCQRPKVKGQPCRTCATRDGTDTTTGKGYGSAHQTARAHWAPVVARGIVHCARCGSLIRTGTPWDLGHVPGQPNRYRGPEHENCNRGEPRRTQDSK